MDINDVDVLVFDFETYYGPKFTLTQLSYTDYVDDKQFEVHGCALATSETRRVAKLARGEKEIRTRWLYAEQVRTYFHRLFNPPRPRTHPLFLVAHNAPFDLTILARHYHLPLPAPEARVHFLDTRGMAAQQFAGRTSLSLEHLVKVFGLPDKGDALIKTYGLHTNEIEQDERMWENLKDYALNDARITLLLFLELWPFFTCPRGVAAVGAAELMAMSWTLKQIFLSPYPLCVSLPTLRAAIEGELHEQDSLVSSLCAHLGLSTTELQKQIRSRAMFPKLLTRLGLPPDELPMKISKTTGKLTPALAKNDDALLRLMEKYGGEGYDAGEERGLIGAALTLRSSLASTIRGTRAARLERLPFPDVLFEGDVAPIPVYLQYWGAENTGRWSGGNKTNLQNLPRSTPDHPALLRRAIVPPPGHKLIICDYSSVEARVLAWLAGADSLLETFRSGACVYCRLARRLWPALQPLSDKEIKHEHHELRFLAKTLILGAGYGSGWRTVERYLRTGMGGTALMLGEEMATQLGVTEQGIRSRLAWEKERDGADEEAEEKEEQVPDELFWHYGACMGLVNQFRDDNPEITALWRALGALEDTGGIRFEPWRDEDALHDEGLRMWVPGGTSIIYPYFDNRERQATFKRRTSGHGDTAWATFNIWGGLFAQNATQAVARNLLRDALVKTLKARLHPVLTVHDEIVLVEKEEDAERARDTLLAIMSEAPRWAEGLPLAAEAKIADSYEEK